jgi:hypothetical protein
VTDSPPSLTGDAHEITSPGAYVYYRINVTANNGGTGLDIAELALYGDVAFSITFSDGWVTTNGSNVIPLGSSYTLPTYTSSLPVTVTGAGDFDVNTAGTYRVVYTSIGIDELARRVVRRFVVEYPTIAFHYAGFVATDYNSTYATKEAAAADGFVYADTPDGTYSWGTLAVVSNTTSNTEYTWTPVDSGITADVLMVAGGGGGGGALGGGGGAGGLVFRDNVSLSSQKTIVVGNGGLGGVGDDTVAYNGNNTFVSGFTTVIGGGSGGTYISPGQFVEPGIGGSGGGGGHSNGSTLIPGADGIFEQGNNGGDSYGNENTAGGGGGAGGAGGDATATVSGTGGLGLDMSSSFSNNYGDSGYFASGGGGGARFITVGTSPLGGGTDGTNSDSISSDNAQRHTGGGGGGAFGYSADPASGGDGGSGIVLMKQTAFLFPITFTDGWVPTDGPTAVTSGSGYTLPTASSALTFTVSGSDTFDPDTAGSYTVEYIHTTSTGLVKKVTRRFVVTEPFRYLAFWGGDFGSDTSAGQSLHELELNLGTSLNGYSQIKYQVNDSGLTFTQTKSWTYRTADYRPSYASLGTLMNGIKGWSSETAWLQYNDSSLRSNGGVLLYIDLGSGVSADVSSGDYWTSDEGTGYPYEIGSAKLYGTNTDPSTFTEAQRIDPATYTFICDLTRNYDRT